MCRQRSHFCSVAASSANPAHLSLHCQAVMGLSQSPVRREMGRGGQSIPPCPPCPSPTYTSVGIFFFHENISEVKRGKTGPDRHRRRQKHSEPCTHYPPSPALLRWVVHAEPLELSSLSAEMSFSLMINFYQQTSQSWNSQASHVDLERSSFL